jgi:hypothetical protein
MTSAERRLANRLARLALLAAVTYSMLHHSVFFVW